MKKIAIPRSLRSRKELMFCGHKTWASQLCRIFEITRGTFEIRMASGWPLEAIVTAEAKSGWTLRNAYILASQPAVKEYCQKLMDDFAAEQELYLEMLGQAQAELPSELPLPAKVREFAARKESSDK